MNIDEAIKIITSYRCNNKWYEVGEQINEIYQITGYDLSIHYVCSVPANDLIDFARMLKLSSFS